MERLIVIALAAGALAFSQEQPASASTSQILPNRQKALDSALRNLLSRSHTPPATILRSQAKPATANPADTRCAYIRIIPADPSIDPRIVVPDSGTKAQEPTSSGMPVHPGLPACDSNVTR